MSKTMDVSRVSDLWLCSSTQNLKNLLNLNLALDSKAIQSSLNFSKDIDALRDTKSVGECSSNSCVQENR